jgi:alpha-L-arabinofuranosidase
LDLVAFGDAARDIESWTLGDAKQAGEPDAVNTFDDPERVVPKRSHFSASSGRFEYRFPALSLTVLSCTVR